MVIFYKKNKFEYVLDDEKIERMMLGCIQFDMKKLFKDVFLLLLLKFRMKRRFRKHDEV